MVVEALFSLTFVILSENDSCDWKYRVRVCVSCQNKKTFLKNIIYHAKWFITSNKICGLPRSHFL